MNDAHFLRQALSETKILRPPKQALATFGTTTFHYLLVSPAAELSEGCRLREGDVTAERPKILTPEMWRRRFDGFGEDQEAFQRQVEEAYGESLRGLEYTFSNRLEATSLEHAALSVVTDRIQADLDKNQALRTALLHGPDQRWPLSIMKFIIEMSLRSFPSNVRELDERGFFDPAKRADQRQRASIEKLFREAQQDRSRVQTLASFLKSSGFFAEYEDRFFGLFPGA